MAKRLSTRKTYRHGDLRHALVKAGTDLARKGGPGAVVLREATRRTGVSAAAAYRHFTDHHALLEAVSAAAQSAVANAIEAEQARSHPPPTARDRARPLPRGRAGYIRFARKEPNLFAPPSRSRRPARCRRPHTCRRQRQDPVRLLSAALDDLVATGALPPERRAGAEFLAWSAVHGLRCWRSTDRCARSTRRSPTHSPSA